MGNIYLKYMLIRQLDYLEKFQPELLDLYSSKDEDQIWFSDKLTKYETYIREVLSSTDVPLSYYPTKVIINSEVTLRMVDSESHVTYTICLPEHDSRDVNFVSLTKPIGARLLLAPLHSKVSITERGRKRNVFVEKIEVLPMVAESRNTADQLRVK